MKESITCFIQEFTASYPRLKHTDTSWEEPLVSFAAADNPLFGELKQAVSPDHFMPEDLLPGALAVGAFFIPFKRDMCRTNREGEFSSFQWAEAYVETNRLIDDLNRQLEQFIGRRGFRAAFAPATGNFDSVKLISRWSHRHASYIAGLGKFGLNNMLITSKGCCGRFGSFVTNAPVEAGKFSPGEFCLFKAKGSCGLCMKRCPMGALTNRGFDRTKCYRMCLENEKRFSPRLNQAEVCGKCLVEFPCSHQNPMGD